METVYFANDGTACKTKKETATYNLLDLPYKKQQFDLWDEKQGFYENWYYISSVQDIKTIQDYVKYVVNKSELYDSGRFNIFLELEQHEMESCLGKWISYRITWEQHQEESGYLVHITTLEELQSKMNKAIKQFNELKNVLK